ncbi:hypothetical protein FRX31_035184 [Thalictrum thalictroides]|uniref:Uncharacterized protein n=2 Tax=Thalictrum thalictroides TaxID=46969 RepID=A0A7J6URV1_THATH|nr:hypothetical protein FRX31_035184 [Thalictrum thalictroides]
MAPKLEVLKGSGGSIRVGTTGTIGFLMTKELEMKCTPQSPMPPRQNPSAVSVSDPCGVVNSSKKLQPRGSSDEASSSSSNRDNRNMNFRQPDSSQKTRRNTRKSTYKTPILTSDKAPVGVTPKREKADKKIINFVEVVDIRCGHPNKWSSPIASRFKKLNSSKLSETIG